MDKTEDGLHLQMTLSLATDDVLKDDLSLSESEGEVDQVVEEDPAAKVSLKERVPKISKKKSATPEGDAFSPIMTRGRKASSQVVSGTDGNIAEVGQPASGKDALEVASKEYGNSTGSFLPNQTDPLATVEEEGTGANTKVESSGAVDSQPLFPETPVPNTVWEEVDSQRDLFPTADSQPVTGEEAKECKEDGYQLPPPQVTQTPPPLPPPHPKGCVAR